jgi:nucleoside-diphosphate-sugar epimerase
VKVLVTGGGGFIGSNLARAPVQRGDEVRILDNFLTGNRTNLAELTNEVEVARVELRRLDHGPDEGGARLEDLRAGGIVDACVRNRAAGRDLAVDCKSLGLPP